jgi:hypothetical protein
LSSERLLRGNIPLRRSCSQMHCVYSGNTIATLRATVKTARRTLPSWRSFKKPSKTSRIPGSLTADFIAEREDR